MSAESRQRWRQERADRADAQMHDLVGDIFDLNDSAIGALPPAVQVGWSEPHHVYGGLVYCLTCRPQPPSEVHVAVIRESVVATRQCVVCHRRLDTIT